MTGNAFHHFLDLKSYLTLMNEPRFAAVISLIPFTILSLNRYFASTCDRTNYIAIWTNSYIARGIEYQGRS